MFDGRSVPWAVRFVNPDPNRFRADMCGPVVRTGTGHCRLQFPFPSIAFADHNYLYQQKQCEHAWMSQSTVELELENRRSNRQSNRQSGQVALRTYISYIS